MPVGALYTPLKPRDDLAYITDAPIVCRPPCGAILNPFAQILGNSWVCPICANHNALPPQYQTQLPVQAAPENTTVEYILQQKAQTPPIFLFVVDTCLLEEDFQALKESLLVSLSLLPPNALVGIIAFGKNVNLYELTDDGAGFLKTYAFNGAKDYTTDQISKILGFIAPDLKRQGGPNQTADRFLRPATMAEYQLTLILENLSKDSWNYKSNQRYLRATGCALNVASNLLKTCYSKAGSHIMLFSGGPCTYGPGLIVGNELKEPIRSHHLIEAKEAKHYKLAKDYYSKLAKNCSEIGATIDIFIGAYDQVGLYEMEELPDETGGVVVLSDSFTTSIFKQSFQRFFNKDQYGQLSLGLNANFEVKSSKEWKIAGLIGHATSLNKKDHFVAEQNLFGISGTSSWKISTILPNSSYAILFDIQNSQENAAFKVAGGLPNAFAQFITYYQHPDGSIRLKVTTVAKLLSAANLSFAFDQESAAVLIARIAVNKLQKNEVSDVVSWVDKITIGLLKNFAEYSKNDPSSFKLANNFTYFPQFMYHLRRSQFLQVFNNSPDETAFYRHIFNLEDTTNSLIMIQPTLTSFEQDSEEGEPVLLDSLSIQDEKILLLDTFFHILIFHGSTVAAWRRQGYQDDPEFIGFKEFLELPRLEAAELLIDRFPLPRFIDTEDGGSQARFLMSKLNPSTTYKNQNVNTGARILTDDISLQDFMEHVQKLVVAP